MLRSAVRSTAQSASPASDVVRNPYRAKRLWPPDFSQLPAKHQFRLERKYRRRCQLKWARPRWNKFVKLAQLTTISFVVVYGVLFMDWSSEIKAKTCAGGPSPEPFQGIRNWYRNSIDSIWPRQ